MTVTGKAGGRDGQAGTHAGPGMIRRDVPSSRAASSGRLVAC